MTEIPLRKLDKANCAIGQGDFKIRRLGDVMGEADLDQSLHRHDFYFILALEDGEGEHVIDFQAHEIRPYTLFLMRPGQAHKIKLKAGSKGYLIEFNLGFFSSQPGEALQQLRKASYQNVYLMDKEEYGQLDLLFRRMHQEHEQQQYGFLSGIRALLSVLFLELLRKCMACRSKEGSGTYALERFEEFRDLMEKHLKEVKQVAEYAAMMNLSVFQLNAITKAARNKSSSELISEQIVLEAKRYLLAGTEQIKEIAWQLGYEDVSYFIRFFRKKTGYAPNEFRQRFA